MSICFIKVVPLGIEPGTQGFSVLLRNEVLKTTAIYAYVSQQSFVKIKNPLDRILEDKDINISNLKTLPHK